MNGLWVRRGRIKTSEEEMNRMKMKTSDGRKKLNQKRSKEKTDELEEMKAGEIKGQMRQRRMKTSGTKEGSKTKQKEGP